MYVRGMHCLCMMMCLRGRWVGCAAPAVSATCMARPEARPETAWPTLLPCCGAAGDGRTVWLDALSRRIRWCLQFMHPSKYDSLT